MDHKSHKCEHKIVLCAPCDVVYCDRCYEEWTKPIFTWSNTWSNTWPYAHVTAAGITNNVNHDHI